MNFFKTKRITSAERGGFGTFVTRVLVRCYAILAIFIFPRTTYKPRFVFCSPAGIDGDGNTSGRIMKYNFIKFSKHFIHFSKILKEQPVLFLDDHNLLYLLKQHVLTVLFFLTYYSHKLQLLDRSVLTL